MEEPIKITNNGHGITITGDQTIKIIGCFDFNGIKTETKTSIEVEKIPKHLQNAYIQICLSLYGVTNKATI